MSDFVTVLEHSRYSMGKTWQADGKINAHPNAEQYKHHEVKVSDIKSLSKLLLVLANDRKRCAVVRGKFKGLEYAKANDPEFKEGRCRKTNDNFDDLPHHWVMFDIDKFVPVLCDPVHDPLGAIDEYITHHLPDPFQGASYHWQLSSSFGHATTSKVLKAHIWFWLETPYNCEQLKAWKENNQINIDGSVLQVTQLHYTANPTMEAGVEDLVECRGGLHEGWLSETVPLVIDTRSLEGARGVRLTKRERFDNMIEKDKVARRLRDMDMIKSVQRDGALNIICPFEEFHNSGSSESTTVYYLPNTGGYAEGRFHCKHEGCKDRPAHTFLQAIGIDPIADDFDEVPLFEGDAEKNGGVGSAGGANGLAGSGEGVASGASGAGGADPLPVVRKRVPKAQHLVTDQANAQRIVQHFRGKIISAGDKWYSWNGKYWEQDDNAVYVRAMNLSKIVHQEAEEWEAKPGGTSEEKDKNCKIAENLRAWAKKCEMRATIEAALYLAKRALGIDVEHLDRNPWLLTCANCTIDLRTGKTKPHDPEDYITKTSPCAYVEGTKATLFEDVLSRVTQESCLTTRPVASFLKRWFGYCATASVREQKFVVHYGGGRNGKSTILDTIGDVLGDYAGTAAPGLIAGGKTDRHPTEIADLLGRRMVTAHESGEGQKLHEDFVKQATGGDRLKARWMRGDFFEFVPTHKLQLLTNYKPEIRGQDEGIWRRVLLVPYMVRFGTPEEVANGEAQYLRDTSIAEHIERERDAILTWVVEGAVEWFRDGLNPPDVVKAASKDYQSEQDRVQMFVHECCELKREGRVSISTFRDELYAPYRRWCDDNGYHPLGKRKLTSEILRVVPYARTVEGKAEGANGRRKCIFIEGLEVCHEF